MGVVSCVSSGRNVGPYHEPLALFGGLIREASTKTVDLQSYVYEDPIQWSLDSFKRFLLPFRKRGNSQSFLIPLARRCVIPKGPRTQILGL